MSQSCCYACCPGIVERYGSAVRERQLQLALALLACDTSCHTAVHLVCQPVLACHSLKLQHITEILCQALVEGGVVVETCQVICHDIILALDSLVHHVCLW